MKHIKTTALIWVVASFSVASWVYAWNYATPVSNGDLVSADKWNAIVAQLIAVSVNPDWNASTWYAQILNKPVIPAAQVNTDWNATSGVAQILNKPTIPAAQVNSDWNATSWSAQILNKPNIFALAGNVGIATANPAAKLEIEVAGAAQQADGLSIDYPSGYPSGAALSITMPSYAGSSRNLIQASSAAAGSNFTVRSDGFVGIGTPGPLSKLHVKSADVSAFMGATMGNIFVDSTTSSSDIWRTVDFGSTASNNNPWARIGVQNTGGGTYLVLGTSNNYASGITNQAITINPSGNVGIGTTSPSVPLHVRNDSMSNLLRLQSATANSDPYLLIQNDATYWTAGVFGGDSDKFKIRDGSDTARLTIDTSGNVGIGTTSPAAKLDVAGAVQAQNSNQPPYLSITNRSTLYTSSTAGWTHNGTSVTFTVPPWPNRVYRIAARAMAYASPAGNYMLLTVSNTSTAIAGIPIGLGTPYEYALDTGRHTVSTEWYVTLAPWTYTYYMMVYGGSSYTMNYHYHSDYTNILVWPM